MAFRQMCSAKSLERALDYMESLGLKTGAATPQDAELLYLHKQAYLTKVDRDPGTSTVSTSRTRAWKDR
ncbi:hypothetical protein [Desulfacinum hydrothermale]|nr:hypothetical protein [Desulfacinum hydrothermale]